MLLEHYIYSHLTSKGIGKLEAVSRVLEFIGPTSLWRDCGTPYLWVGLIPKFWPVGRCQRRQNLLVQKFNTNIAWRHPSLILHTNNEKEGCSHVLYSSPCKVVYFAPSTICLEEWPRLKVVPTVDDSYSLWCTLVFSVQWKCHHRRSLRRIS